MQCGKIVLPSGGPLHMLVFFLLTLVVIVAPCLWLLVRAAALLLRNL